MTERMPTYEGWAILELMGHRRLAGYLRAVELAGAGMLRIDVPGDDAAVATQFYSPAAVYCVTPTTEAIARSVAKQSRPEPVHRWEVPPAKTLSEASAGDEPDDHLDLEDVMP